MKTTRKLWIGIAILVVLSPLGLLLPAWLGGGTAWGEWSSEELRTLLGHVPAGMQHIEGLWRAPLPDYGLPGQQAKPVGPSAAYILSAVVGAIIVTVLAYGLGRLLSRREEGADDT